MNLASIPAKFALVWASTGVNVRVPPTASQISVQAGAASLTDGFPPLCLTPTGSGGIPPFGQDINGILQQVTAWLRWAQAGGPIIFDATYAGQISGYPKGAVLQAVAQTGAFWYNTTDGNTANPDTGGAGWVNFFAPVFASPTFSGTATFGGPVVTNSTVSLNQGFTTPFGTGSDSSGFYTVNQVTNNATSFLTPAAAIATFENANGNALQVCYSGVSSIVQAFFIRLQSTLPAFMGFNYRGSTIGGVIPNGTTAVQYLTTSDERVKTNLEPLKGALARVAAVPVYDGNRIDQPDAPKQPMFLAHEFLAALPHAGRGERGEEHDIGEVFVPAGTPVAYGVDEPAEIPAGHVWQRSGYRVGEKTGLLRRAPKIPTGEIVLAEDHVVMDEHPEPEDKLPPGQFWRKTDRVPRLQMIDKSESIPLLFAAIQELTAEVNALKKERGGDSAAAA